MPKICRWGNSLGLRLPKDLALAAGLSPGSFVQVRLLDNGSILLVPTGTKVAVAAFDTVTGPSKSVYKW